jgi:phosphatidylglycerophosphate synthase
MQAVIAIPESSARTGQEKTSALLVWHVAGVPLLKRTILTAIRAGGTEIVLISSDILGHALARQTSEEIASAGIRIRFILSSRFDPRDVSSWIDIGRRLNNTFLWVPWNWVTSKQFLKDLPLQGMASVDWAKPAQVSLREISSTQTSALMSSGLQGILATSSESIASAERFLVAHSGKVLDGIHTSFNRKLCRPFVRMLSHASITPNQVTFGGVIVSVLSAFAFAQGGYLYSVLGAVLFYVAGLFDEMDGMLARIKFAESPRGTWLEGFADGLSYLLLFGGITIGLSHRYGSAAIVMGIVLLAGSIFALVATALQRRLATAADRPNEYLGRMYQLLDKDSENWISRVVRQLQAFVRRGIMVHYIVIFTVIGALPLIFFLATVGAHLTWILTLYFNRRFFAQSFRVGVTSTVNTIKETA